MGSTLQLYLLRSNLEAQSEPVIDGFLPIDDRKTWSRM